MFYFFFFNFAGEGVSIDLFGLVFESPTHQYSTFSLVSLDLWVVLLVYKVSLGLLLMSVLTISFWGWLSSLLLANCPTLGANCFRILQAGPAPARHGARTHHCAVKTGVEGCKGVSSPDPAQILLGGLLDDVLFIQTLFHTPAELNKNIKD